MDKIERIAKLHDLRNAGGLTDEEFERQKERILAGPKWLLIVGLALLVAIAAAGLTYVSVAPKYTAGAKVPDALNVEVPQAVVPEAIENSAGSLPEALPVPAPATASGSRLSQIFVPATLGARLAYLENMTGVARNAVGDMRTYNVDGCEIQALVRSGVVNGLAMNVSPSCSFNLDLFFTNEHFGAANRLRFGDLPTQYGAGRMSADCLEGCGNAADPAVRITGGGFHADNWYTLTAEATLGADDALNAAQAWIKPMAAAKGEDWVTDGDFNCDHTYDPIALGAFRTVKATRVIVGDGSVEPKCSENWPI